MGVHQRQPCTGAAATPQAENQADHFHLDSESSRDLGGGAGLLCLGDERGVVLAA